LLQELLEKESDLLILSKNRTLHSLLAGNHTSGDFSGKNVFKGAKLLPFPNRIEDGKYSFEGKSYNLDLNYPEENNACHGFIYDKEFSVSNIMEDKDNFSITFLYHYSGALPGYPFPFMAYITYTLSSSDGFKCRTRVENLGQTSMPAGDGWHPFFTFNTPVDELLLRFPAEKKIEVDERLLPTGTKKAFSAFNVLKKIERVEFDTCFALHPDSSGIQTSELYSADKDVTLQLCQEIGPDKYNYLQIYTPPNRKSIAIEPMTCNINAFNNLEGLIILEPGEIFSAEYGVKLL